MEQFLKQLHLSENAIKIYLQSLGRLPLSFFELNSIIPNLSKGDFQNTINELVEQGLLIPIIPQAPEIVPQYLAIPPFNPIISYISNINANLESIKNQLHQLLANTLKKIFQQNVIIELDTTFTAIHELRKDFEEETIIQKQDVDDIVQGMENLKVTEQILNDLHQTVKGLIQVEFSNLIKLITNLKNEILKNLELIDLKKQEQEVKMVIENVFKSNLDKLLKDFTIKLYELIETEFTNTIESLNNIISSTFRFRDDFKMLLVNILNNFEIKINNITEFIKKKKETLSDDLNSFEQAIEKSFDQIIRNSVESVAALNNPIDKLMKGYYLAITKSDAVKVNDFWLVKNLSRVNEEIKNLINNSKNELTLILPKIENHLELEQFKKISSTLKIKIASSEAHTNSNVKKFKEIKALEYRTLKNENIIIMKGDDNYIAIGVVENKRDSMNNFIGFGSNYKPLINLIEPIIKTTWNIASSDLYEAPKSIGMKKPVTSDVEVSKPEALKPFKPISEPKSVPPADSSLNVKKGQFISPSQPMIRENDFSQKIQHQVSFTSEVSPKEGDETSNLINNAFNTLIQKLGSLKGYQFSQELQSVSDLILEKKGFSTTLHKLRSLILKYKENDSVLNQTEINEIVQNIDEWKKHLL
ncbi:MAG: hypothetical protein ACFFD5_00650 [Candidatus Thorarchaeota archaeon]